MFELDARLDERERARKKDKEETPPEDLEEQIKEARKRLQEDD